MYSAITENAMVVSLKRWNAKRSWFFVGNLASLQPTGFGETAFMNPEELHDLDSYLRLVGYR
jgi:hypothetical protein